jgi:UMF1 family MFS transporter
LLTLAVCLAYVELATAAGRPAAHYVPVTLYITAVVFAVAASPTFIWLRERARPHGRATAVSYLRQGYGEVRRTLRRAMQFRDLFRFLGCLVLFQSGVATVIVVAAIYAQQVMGFSERDLIVLIMVVNLTAAAGAFAFGFAQDRFGSVPSLIGALLLWIAAIIFTFLADSPADLWLAGNLMGAAMGATQSGGRALVGRLTPVAHSGEFFGLWGMANRAAAILGPLSYGLLSHFSQGDHRLALLSTLAMFTAGLLLLPGINEARGMQAREQWRPA